ncbi:hypothetical protein [Salibaculum griseiflavum]|uniref:hypothetical protein n=1 Tax=Salibaculum griseiflavum TaxID=1914409 RepID=UPI001C38AC25|nr:hypothetical protein [Salibaculum griseiflavum]
MSVWDQTQVFQNIKSCGGKYTAEQYSRFYEPVLLGSLSDWVLGVRHPTMNRIDHDGIFHKRRTDFSGTPKRIDAPHERNVFPFKPVC